MAMKISGITLAKDALKYDYPLKECVETLLAICDEVVIVIGESEDDTLNVVKSINNPKLSILQSKWDKSLGYKVLSHLTNLAINNCSGEWGLYLQCDEIIHEDYFSPIRKEIEKNNENEIIEGLLFNYRHFYGSYNLYNASRKFYRNEVRAIRLGIGIESWKDAKGFRRKGRKLIVKSTPVEIFHYGWARNPDVMKKKSYNFHKLWHSETEIEKFFSFESDIYDINTNFNLFPFTGTHPALMKERIEKSKWSELAFQQFLSNRKDRKFLLYPKKLISFVERKTWWLGYNRPYSKFLK